MMILLPLTTDISGLADPTTAQTTCTEEKQLETTDFASLLALSLSALTTPINTTANIPIKENNTSNIKEDCTNTQNIDQVQDSVSTDSIQLSQAPKLIQPLTISQSLELPHHTYEIASSIQLNEPDASFQIIKPIRSIQTTESTPSLQPSEPVQAPELPQQNVQTSSPPEIAEVMASHQPVEAVEPAKPNQTVQTIKSPHTSSLKFDQVVDKSTIHIKQTPDQSSEQVKEQLSYVPISKEPDLSFAVRLTSKPLEKAEKRIENIAQPGFIELPTKPQDNVPPPPAKSRELTPAQDINPINQHMPETDPTLLVATVSSKKKDNVAIVDHHSFTLEIAQSLNENSKVDSESLKIVNTTNLLTTNSQPSFPPENELPIIKNIQSPVLNNNQPSITMYSQTNFLVDRNISTSITKATGLDLLIENSIPIRTLSDDLSTQQDSVLRMPVTISAVKPMLNDKTVSIETAPNTEKPEPNLNFNLTIEATDKTENGLEVSIVKSISEKKKDLTETSGNVETIDTKTVTSETIVPAFQPNNVNRISDSRIVVQVTNPILLVRPEMRSPETRTIEVSLTPESLGKVEIRVATDVDGHLSAHLAVEQESSRHILSDNISHLRETMEKAGLIIDRLDISSGSSLSTNMGNQQDKQTSTHTPHYNASYDSSPNPAGTDDDAVIQDQSLRDRLLSLRA